MATEAEIIAQNLAAVRANIEAACRKAGRSPADVTLVAVVGKGSVRCLAPYGKVPGTLQSCNILFYKYL